MPPAPGIGRSSSLGTAAGPLAGSVLSARAGFPAMGGILAVGLVVIAVPMTGVALHAGGRLPLPGTVRRRGGTPAGGRRAGVRETVAY